MSEVRYIHIPRWEEFQHYGNRDPIWIRTYTRLLSDHTYRKLPGHVRAILHGLWMEYARSRSQIVYDTAVISSQLGLKVSTAHLQRLENAGFITVSASNVLAQIRVEKSREEPPTGPPPNHGAFLTLAGIEKPGYGETKFTRERFDRLAAQNPHADLQVEAEALRDWEIHGTGAKQATKDGITRFRNWLARSQTLPDSPLASEIDYPLLPGVAPR